MATVVKSVGELCQLLGRSRLLKTAEAQQVERQWRQRQPRPGAGEIDPFVKWLVASHYLTGYQAQQLLVGKTDQLFLNHYKLLELVSQGRMAGVFKAAHVSGHIVAIKLLPASKAADPQLLARFQREARMAVRLKHPHVVRTFHLGQAGGRYYLVMEYLEGETLEEVLQRRQRLPPAEAARLMYQALLGLQHVHENGLVHRDLKPANFMLVPPRPPGAPDDTLHATLKVLDIGLGRVLFDENIVGDPESQMLTTEGMLLGTPQYMSPEQARNAHKVDIRTDLYSVGCVLYHLIAGQTPFSGRDFQQLVAHARDPVRPIRELVPAVPDGLQAFIHNLMAKDPAQRYPTPAHAAQALKPFLPRQEAGGLELSSLARSYLKWLETQGVEEKNAAPVAMEKWFYTHGGLTFGPVSAEHLGRLASAGKLAPDDLLWMEGDDPELAIRVGDALALPAASAGKPAPRQVTPAPAAPARPSKAIPAKPRSESAEESGYDPDTGQILDPDKFKKWQREQKLKKQQSFAAMPTAHEAYLKASIHLDRWLDFDRNRRTILAGDMDCIRRDADIQRFMRYYGRFGQDMVHRLWQHLHFMVENRRKYYLALG